jgi:intracellular septation protein A
MALESGQRAGEADVWADLSASADPPGAFAHSAETQEAETQDVHGDAVESDLAADKQAETQAYEDAVKKAFGGTKGMADVGLPSLVFLIVYTATKHLTPALWSAVAVAVVLTAVRLFRKETLQHSLSGLLGVLVSAGVAKFLGRPQDYYLPGLLLNAGYAVAFVVSALVRWPVVGLMLGPITGEMTMWRQVPGRLRAFTLATWILAALFAFRLAVQTPLFLAGQITALGIARTVMGYPLYLAALYACWQIIKQAPPPVKPATGPEAAETE